MASWIHEIPYGSGASSTWDGNDLGDGLNTWDSSTDSWDGKTITNWTHEQKST